MKLDYLVLPAENVNEVRAWYRDHLDLDVAWESEDFALLSGDDGARLGIHRGRPLSESERVNLHFEVEDVDRTYEERRAAGLEFSSPPQETDWGYRTAVCHDPAGHTVEIFTPMRP